MAACPSTQGRSMLRLPLLCLFRSVVALLIHAQGSQDPRAPGRLSTAHKLGTSLRYI
ncbi:hypothetical protein H8959_019202 [Pygathrix nigripes]